MHFLSGTTYRNADHSLQAYTSPDICPALASLREMHGALGHVLRLNVTHTEEAGKKAFLWQNSHTGLAGWEPALGQTVSKLSAFFISSRWEHRKGRLRLDNVSSSLWMSALMARLGLGLWQHRLVGCSRTNSVRSSWRTRLRMSNGIVENNMGWSLNELRKQNCSRHFKVEGNMVWHQRCYDTNSLYVRY
jgi:hypothetical protein